MADPVSPYPFPSNVHVVSSVTLKLTDSNYLLWKTQFESLLSSQKLSGFINGTIAAPPASHTVVVGGVPTIEPNPLYEAWFCTDQLVRSWLFGTLSEEVLGVVHSLSTSREVWLGLAENFNQSSLAREFALRRNLQFLTKKGKTLTEYCRELKTICDALASIGKPVDESMKLFGFLNGLGREYDPVSTGIQRDLSKPNPPSFNDVVSEIQAYDCKLQSYEVEDSSNTPLVFNAQNANQNASFKPAVPSYNPNNRGRGRYGQNRGRGGYSSRGRGFPQHQTTQNNNGERPVCQICGRVGHIAAKCYNRYDDYQAHETPQAFTALQTADATGKEWYPDSGATAHITATRDNLQTSTQYDGNDTIMVADGAFLPITHVGSANIASTTGTITLKDVLVCPEIQKSLLSVSKLCDDHPCGVWFDANKVCVVDIGAQKVVAKGPRVKGLYTLKNQELVALYSNRQCAASEDTWHHRLGHTNFKVLQQLQISKEIVINKSRQNSICEPCQMGKSSRLQFISSSSRVLGPLDRVHCDLWGPSPIVSTLEFKYYAVFIDDYSRFSWFYPLRAKSEFYSVFTAFQKLVETQFSTKIKVFQSDGGGEFINKRLQSHFVECGIKHLVSCPYTPQQNGLAERKHRHLVELGLSMLFHSNTPLSYWVEAFFSANFICNLLPMDVLENCSPFEVLFGKKPEYSMLRVFGSACYPYLRPLADHKLEPRSLQCVFIGYSSQHKGYRCLYPPTGKTYICRHVVFDEECFPFKAQYESLVPRYHSKLLSAWQLSTSQATEEQRTETQISRALPVPSRQLTQEPTVEDHPTPEPINEAPSDTESVDAAPVENQHPMVTRAKAGIIKPNTRYILLANKFTPATPKSIAEAMKHPGWNVAVMDEMGRIHMLHTWSLVPRTEDMNVLSSKWVFTPKMKPNGELNKLKARLVAKGFEQEEGLDYLETFSPVVRTATIRMILDVAIARDWPIKQLDVSNAFLHGELKEPVYMFQPAGFEDPERPDYVCKLTKALYGLKQAPRAWFDTFSNYIIDYGFTCSKSDPSLFTYYRNGKSMVLLMYVDDMLLTGSDQALLQDLLTCLNKPFSMKDLGRPHYFLGVEIESYNGGMFLHQTAYAKEILHHASMSDCNSMPTPLPLQLDDLNSEPFSEPTYFRSLAGKLQYLTITRPDIQFAVNFVCQRMHSPTVSDFNLLKRILRYIKGTINMGLHIKKDKKMVLHAYCDSDYAGCKDTRRSTSGFCTMLGSNLISWSAKRQQTVSKSSTEAEYRALTAAAQEITWLSFLLRDLGVEQKEATVLKCDNKSAVYLSTNPALHNRSKHFDTDYHYVREQVALGLIETQHVPATQQLADIFTKSLPKKSFKELRSKLGVAESPTLSLRGAESECVKAQESVQAHSAVKEKRTKPAKEKIVEEEKMLTFNRFESLVSANIE
ncbi:unnamed protein product [Microthlaspi erraticum]|uniref:Integrase catalytic domain-containing protein n=1 Tax=Microthlaspi erraticum TaxID=1685480 RepID=A0A6D2J8Z1_9BRAS|nr:unnamed protein product [Microthlaspi erraticum]